MRAQRQQSTVPAEHNSALHHQPDTQAHRHHRQIEVVRNAPLKCALTRPNITRVRHHQPIRHTRKRSRCTAFSCPTAERTALSRTDTKINLYRQLRRKPSRTVPGTSSCCLRRGSAHLKWRADHTEFDVMVPAETALPATRWRTLGLDDHCTGRRRARSFVVSLRLVDVIVVAAGPASAAAESSAETPSPFGIC